MQQGNGLPQGCPDSPVLFAGLMGDAIGPILGGEGDNPIPKCRGICMDDIYLWAEPLQFLQTQVSRVEQVLAKGEFCINR